ncbi:MAG: hypothetical protein J6Y77_01220 [Paludibacteraceae bacterium]|nr:hypothetical protein [Paludibacteraceae bacterium]
MATPIAPTPPLHGQAALDFIAEMEKNKKASPEEKERIRKVYERWLTYCEKPI